MDNLLFRVSLTKSDQTKRRLLFGDTDDNNYKNLDFNSLQEALKNSSLLVGFARQVYFVDACANPIYTEHFDITRAESAGEKFSSNGDAKNNEQFVLFAAAEYEIAENEAGNGSFFKAVMEELNKLPKDCLLPDMKPLTEQIKRNFKAQDKPIPIQWKINWDGSQESSSGFRTIDWRKVSREMFSERRKLTTNLLTSAEGVALQVEDVYVGLGLVERKKPSKLQGEIFPQQGSEQYKEIEITQKFEHDQFLKEVIKEKKSPKSQGKRLALIGEPGAGKTTRLQQIADWIFEEIEESIVVWISLGDLQGKQLEDYLLETWLTAAVRKLGKADITEIIKDNFATQFRQGRVCLLLDGLDEMSVSSGNPLTEIARQIKEGGAISQTRIVLTCRVNLWDGSSNALDDFDTYRTLDFSYPAQVEEFVEKWFSKIPEIGKQRGQDLCTALKQPGKERIQDLVKNPLRLTLLCLNWQSREGALPDTQAGLYERFVNDFYKWKQEQFANTNQRRQLNLQLGELAKQAIDQESSRFYLQEEFVCKFFGERENWHWQTVSRSPHSIKKLLKNPWKI